MLCIIIGVVLAAVLIPASLKCRGYRSDYLFGFAVVVAFLSVIAGLFVATGYQEPVLTEEIELVSLNNELATNGKGNLLYVSISTDNTYSYKYEVNDEYNLGGKSYEVGTVKENVTEVESKECDKAVLKVYKIKPKATFISFGLGASKAKYVFYVPEGTVQKEIILK